MQLRSKMGNSLAEFAVVISLMAILIGAGQVRFSQSTGKGKAKKSAEAINKIIMAANNFYLNTSTEEGIGRFPGQDRWNHSVPDSSGGGGYNSVEDALEDLKVGNFDRYSKGSAYGQKWVSVFGKNNSLAQIDNLYESIIHDDDGGSNIGHVEWMDYVDVMKSPFQDGHFIYTVISGDSENRPAIIVTDLYSPADDYIVFRP